MASVAVLLRSPNEEVKEGYNRHQPEGGDHGVRVESVKHGSLLAGDASQTVGYISHHLGMLDHEGRHHGLEVAKGVSCGIATVITFVRLTGTDGFDKGGHNRISHGVVELCFGLALCHFLLRCVFR